jgi:O-antigen ligase
MRVALEEGPAAGAPSSVVASTNESSPFGLALLAVCGGLVAGAIFLGDGSRDARVFWLGSAAALAVCTALGAALAGAIPWPRLTRAGRLLVIGLAGLVAVNALSIAWSMAPDLSWNYANRGFTYLALLAIGIFAGALVRKAPVYAAAALTAVVAAAAGWALAGKIAPALYADGGRIARLRAPVGYWNALALLLATGMPLALWLASRLSLSRRLRALGPVLLYALVVATLLTYSRGGIAAAAIAVLVWLAISPTRARSVASVAVAVPPALLAAGWAFTRSGLVDDLQPYEARFRAGWQFGVVFLVGCLVVFALYLALAPRLETRLRPFVSGDWMRMAALVAAGLILIGGVAAVVVEHGAREGPQVTQAPSRIGSLDANNRLAWWRMSARSFRNHPFGGTGAGSFQLVNLRERRSSLTTTEPHNVPLQFLGETGILGFAFLAIAVVAGVLAVRESLRRLPAPEHPAAAALVAGMAAYVVHSLADKDWDYIAVGAPFFVGLGIVVASGLEAGVRNRRRLWPALGAVLVVWAALYSLAAPYFAARAVDRAYAEIGTNEAIEQAKRAHSLNPLALDPLFAGASANDVLGFQVSAKGLLDEAVALQPDNPEPWYRRADFEFNVIKTYGPAYRDALRAYRLDPYDPDIGALKDAVEKKFLQLKAAECAAGKC